MNHPTIEEILGKMKQVFDSEKRYPQQPDTIEVTKDEEGYTVHVENMYEYVRLSFAMLLKVSEFFGTQNIEVTNEYSVAGCETCDYGSCYSYDLKIRKESGQ